MSLTSKVFFSYSKGTEFISPTPPQSKACTHSLTLGCPLYWRMPFYSPKALRPVLGPLLPDRSVSSGQSFSPERDLIGFIPKSWGKADFLPFIPFRVVHLRLFSASWSNYSWSERRKPSGYPQGTTQSQSVLHYLSLRISSSLLKD